MTLPDPLPLWLRGRCIRLIHFVAPYLGDGFSGGPHLE